MSRFPDCFPPDFEENILPKDAENTAYRGYRLAKYGTDDPRSYWSYFEEMKEEGRLDRLDDDKLRDAGIYGTSLFDSLDYMQYMRRLVFRRPEAPIVVGSTEPVCGPVEIGIEKKRNRIQYRHINWWIYKDATPWTYFQEVGDEPVDDGSVGEENEKNEQKSIY